MRPDNSRFSNLSLLLRHKPEKDRQSDGLRPCAAAWSLDGSSASAKSESPARREVESAAAPEETDLKGKQELEGRDIGVAGTGLSMAKGDATIESEAGETGETTDCTGAEERTTEGQATEAGAGSMAG